MTTVYISLYFMTQHQQGYRLSILRSVLVFSLATLPCGVGLLFVYWFPHVTLKLIAYKCSMECATYILLKVWIKALKRICTHA